MSSGNRTTAMINPATYMTVPRTCKPKCSLNQRCAPHNFLSPSSHLRTTVGTGHKCGHRTKTIGVQDGCGASCQEAMVWLDPVGSNAWVERHRPSVDTSSTSPVLCLLCLRECIRCIHVTFAPTPHLCRGKMAPMGSSSTQATDMSAPCH